MLRFGHWVHDKTFVGGVTVDNFKHYVSIYIQRMYNLLILFGQVVLKSSCKIKLSV